jgi:hypothetical protein
LWVQAVASLFVGCCYCLRCASFMPSRHSSRRLFVVAFCIRRATTFFCSFLQFSAIFCGFLSLSAPPPRLDTVALVSVLSLVFLAPLWALVDTATNWQCATPSRCAVSVSPLRCSFSCSAITDAPPLLSMACRALTSLFLSHLASVACSTLLCSALFSFLVAGYLSNTS